MRKEYYFYISLIIPFIIWFFYYNRPLNLNWLTDPWEEYFTLPERTLPSSRNLINKSYGIQNPTTVEIEKLWVIDKTLQNYNIKWESLHNYSMTSWWKIIKIYRDQNSELFHSGDNRDIIEYHLNNLASYISWYELYPPRMDFATAIPSFNGHQSIFRVGSLYSSLLCHQWQQEQCTHNFRTLFRFSQQMKKSWTLVSLLIGIVEEGIVINHIEYLINSGPEQYQFLITMLQGEQYFPAREALHNAFVSEYTILKNEINNLPLNFIAGYDMINTIQWWYGQRDPTELVLGIFKILRIPPKGLFDIPETLSLARSFYYKNITNPDIPWDEFSDNNMVQNYRTKWHPLLRKNIIGYLFLNAVIPRLTGIQTRAYDSEARFTNLIQE